MGGVRTMGIKELRPVLGDRVDAAFYADEPTVITSHGKPRAAIVPHDWYVEMCKAKGIPVDTASGERDNPSRS
jgi:prevent-host-death family protein